MRQSCARSEPGRAGEAERVCSGWAPGGWVDGCVCRGKVSFGQTLPAPLGVHYLLRPTGTGTALPAPSSAGTAHSPEAGPVGQTRGFQRLWLLGKTLRTRSPWGPRVARRGLEAVRESDGTQDFAAWTGLEVPLRRRWLPQCAPETRCAVSRCGGSAWSKCGLLARPAGSRFLPTWGAQ